MSSANRRSIGLILSIALTVTYTTRSNGAGPSDDKQRLARGKELFTREWLPGDKRSHAGTGLGPVFNARSCVACHSQGGIGGAGPKQTNITFVSAVLLDGTNEQLDRDKLAKIHPTFRTGSSFHLHRFGLDPEFGRWKANLLLGNRFAEGRMRDEIIEANLLAPFATRFFEKRRNVGEAAIELHLSERNPPALFGLGLIEKIPDRVLINVAIQQSIAAEGITQAEAGAAASAGKTVPRRPGLTLIPVLGRVARLTDGRIGRFGWKGQIATVREFAMQACANELGLEVPGFARSPAPWKEKDKAPGIDLTKDECQSLVQFIQSLPPPGNRPGETPQHAAAIAAGRKLFEKTGCATCHRPNLGDVEGIYSDLLLHDMGPLVIAVGEYTTGSVQTAAETAFDVDLLPVRIRCPTNEPIDLSLPRFGAAPEEWRTPPLWGLRDSGPYMHDGRADTIAGAVALHAGESLAASLAFFRLSPTERLQIELFLQSLEAPAQR